LKRWHVKTKRELVNHNTPYTPGILYEYQNKGVAKFAFCNWMRTREIVGPFKTQGKQGESSHGREREEPIAAPFVAQDKRGKQARIGFDIHVKE
jgi:hypothetical protein